MSEHLDSLPVPDSAQGALFSLAPSGVLNGDCMTKGQEEAERAVDKTLRGH